MQDALIISNILLWLIVLVMGVVIFALVRQIGVLYERVAPAGALMLNKQLQVGMDAPVVEAQVLSGDNLTIGGVLVSGKSQLVYFLSHDCPVCKSMLPVLRSAAQAEHKWLDVVLASDGVPEDHKRFVAKEKLIEFPYVLSEVLGMTYGVSKLPYAVLIDEHGKIASLGIINSREHLESLFEAKERKVASIQEYVQKKNDSDQLFTEVR